MRGNLDFARLEPHHVERFLFIHRSAAPATTATSLPLESQTRQIGHDDIGAALVTLSHADRTYFIHAEGADVGVDFVQRVDHGLFATLDQESPSGGVVERPFERADVDERYLADLGEEDPQGVESAKLGLDLDGRLVLRFVVEERARLSERVAPEGGDGEVDNGWFGHTAAAGGGGGDVVEEVVAQAQRLRRYLCQRS